LLTLARSNDALSEAELKKNAARMSWLVTVVHESMTRLVVPKQELYPQIPLTAREIEVLRWTAEGKTSSEVGKIMNICERTVNFHVNNSLEKLGAVNKTACVVKAAMLRLL
jgi:LuxR family transcriptional regulator